MQQLSLEQMIDEMFSQAPCKHRWAIASELIFNDCDHTILYYKQIVL